MRWWVCRLCDMPVCIVGAAIRNDGKSLGEHRSNHIPHCKGFKEDRYLDFDPVDLPLPFGFAWRRHA